MEKSKIGGLQIGIILLVLATAVIHFWVGVQVVTKFGAPPTLILNGAGYLALLGALYLPIAFLLPHRKSISWVLIGYTALTFVLYFVLRGSGAFKSTIGLVDKAIEVVLIVLLWLDMRRY